MQRIFALSPTFLSTTATAVDVVRARCLPEPGR